MGLQEKSIGNNRLKVKLDRQDDTQKIQKHNLSVVIFIHTDRNLLFLNTLLCILSNRRDCFSSCITLTLQFGCHSGYYKQ